MKVPKDDIEIDTISLPIIETSEDEVARNESEEIGSEEFSLTENSPEYGNSGDIILEDQLPLVLPDVPQGSESEAPEVTFENYIDEEIRQRLIKLRFFSKAWAQKSSLGLNAESEAFNNIEKEGETAVAEVDASKDDEIVPIITNRRQFNDWYFLRLEGIISRWRSMPLILPIHPCTKSAALATASDPPLPVINNESLTEDKLCMTCPSNEARVLNNTMTNSLTNL